MDANKKVESYQRELQLSTNSDYLNYLTQTRGLSIRSVEIFKLGLDDYKNITIPIFDSSDKFVGFRYRANPFNKQAEQKYWHDKGMSNLLFNVQNIRQPEFLVITEGEFDCITLSQFGVPAISQTTGAHLDIITVNQIIQELSPQTIVIAFDNDRAGLKAMYEVAKKAGSLKIPVHFCELDEAKDWNALLVKRRLEKATDQDIKDELLARITTAFDSKEFISMHYKEFETSYLKTIRASEIPDEDIQFLVNPLIIKNGVNLVTAAPKSLKTMLIIHMLVASMDKKEFVGYFETSPIRKALLVDQESLKSEIRKRIEKFQGSTHNFLLTAEDVFFDKNPDLKDQIKLLIDLEGIDVVVIDTMRRVNADMDENSSKDVAKFFATIRAIAEKATVIVVHHETKGSMGNKSSYRGSGDILGAVDSHIYVQKIDKYDNGAKIKISHENARYTGNHDDVEVEFIAEAGRYSFSYLGKSAANRAEQAKVQKEEYMHDLESFILEGESEGRNNKELEAYCKDTFDWGQHKAKELRNELVDQGKIKVYRNFQGGKATHYIHQDFAAQQLNTI